MDLDADCQSIKLGCQEFGCQVWVNNRYLCPYQIFLVINVWSGYISLTKRTINEKRMQKITLHLHI